MADVLVLSPNTVAEIVDKTRKLLDQKKFDYTKRPIKITHDSPPIILYNVSLNPQRSYGRHPVYMVSDNILSFLYIHFSESTISLSSRQVVVFEFESNQLRIKTKYAEQTFTIQE